MFYKKRIEELENKNIKSSKKFNQKISELDDKISNANNKISDLDKNLYQVKESLDKILDILESKKFLKEWKEYQKWKVMKDKLPDIEELYQLKRLKILVAKKSEIDSNISLWKNNWMQFKINLQGYKIQPALDIHNTWVNELDAVVKEIDIILKNIRSKSNQKDLLEVFKLYGISTEWLHP